jgi:hypothetical protein
VQDGVMSSATPQTLNGADLVEHQIQIVTPGVQLQSASGVFSKG